jgi:hypothetical protein
VARITDGPRSHVHFLAEDVRVLSEPAVLLREVVSSLALEHEAPVNHLVLEARERFSARAEVDHGSDATATRLTITRQPPPTQALGLEARTFWITDVLCGIQMVRAWSGRLVRGAAVIESPWLGGSHAT